MKQSLIIIALSFLLVNRAAACPQCNIHNYLAASIQSCTEIQVVEVIKISRKNKDWLKVKEVIRGTRKVGEVITGDYGLDRTDIGTHLLLSNPTSWPPNFPVLPEYLRHEVEFLCLKDRKVRTVDEAVGLIQGVSVETNDAALTYIRENYAECRLALCNAFTALYSRKTEWEKIPFLDHRFGGLLTALMIRPNPETNAFLRAIVSTIANDKPTAFSRTERPVRGEPQGNILWSLLHEELAAPELRDEYRELLLETMRTAEGDNIRWFTYALGLDLAPRMNDVMAGLSPAQREAAAFGLFDLSEYYHSWWAIKECTACQKLALQLDGSRELKALVARQNESLSH